MKTKLSANLLVIGTGILLISALFVNSAATSAPQGPGDVNKAQVNGGIATLYAMDPLAQSFCFGDGQPGMVLQKNQVFNRCSDIEFYNYNTGSLTLGVEGARLATVVDLGSPSDLAHRYGFQDTNGNGQGFASLRLESGTLVILKDYHSQSVQEVKESNLLFQEGKPSAKAPITQGHIYLARLTDQYHKEFQRIVKFMVIAYAPDQSVTIRWQVL